MYCVQFNNWIKIV